MPALTPATATSRSTSRRTSWFRRSALKSHPLLQRDALARLGELGTLMFYLPRTTLNEIADNAGASRIGGLYLAPGVAVFDSVLNDLGSALLPSFEVVLAKCTVQRIDQLSWAFTSRLSCSDRLR